MSNQKQVSQSYLDIENKIDDLEDQGILSLEPGYGYRLAIDLSIFDSPNGWCLCYHAGMGDGFRVVDDNGNEDDGVCKIKDINTVDELEMIVKLFGQKG